MRANGVVVHPSDLKWKSSAGCLAQCLRLLSAAWIEIDVSMVTSDCTHVIVLICKVGTQRVGSNCHFVQARAEAMIARR